jgi:hypothetical protein
MLAMPTYAMPTNATRSALIYKLVTYLLANPLASDSCEGIERWWLGVQAGSGGAVQQAIDWLVSVGAMRRVQAADGRVRYRRGDGAGASDAALAALQSMHAPPQR